ncbi:hypothetical protein EV359DRAFT_83989 [Lentinula novae-zelandiae]|nr:hypothetical protein EV359DRAFT_83989 [Lentinula novae-zelandiae]
MAGLNVPELVWTDLSTPASTESNESNEAFFTPPRFSSRRSAQKLRKLAHPPPSFHAFSAALAAKQAELSFIVDQPSSTESSNFPFIFSEPAARRSASSDYERTFKSQSDSGHSYAYPRSLDSSSSRPLPSLSMADSRTPLLRSLSSLGMRKSMNTSAPTRKLTKRKPSQVDVNQFKPLPIPEPESLPIPPPPTPPSKSVEQFSDTPKRRPSITFAFTIALKRRLSMPKGKAKQEQQIEEETLKDPHKTRSTFHVRSVTTTQSFMPCSSTNPKGKNTEKHLPFLPPPTPPAKDPASFLSPSRVSLPSPALSASTTSSKLRKERKDKVKSKKKKFSIGEDNDDDTIEVPAVPPPPFPLSHAHYVSDPLPQSSSTTAVYDLSLDHDPPTTFIPIPNDKKLPYPPRPPLIRRHDGTTETDGHVSENTIASSSQHASSSSSIEARTQRRWTLALAMTSDELTDEVFVEKVERLRRDSVRVPFEHEAAESKSRSVEGVGGFRGWEFGYLDPDSDDGSDGEDEGYDDDEGLYEGAYDGGERLMADLPRSRSVSVNIGLPHSVSYVSTEINGPNPDPAKAWSSALHAMLITRDLLRTEKNYLNQLRVLLSSSPCVMTPAAQAVAETSFLWGIPGDSLLSSSGVASTTGMLNLATVDSERSTSAALPWPKYPPPSLMHTYLLSLIALSLSLLSEWEKDPTIAGAGRVLVEKEEEIERVFVGWCGVVGGWFTQNDDGSGKKVKLSREEPGLKRSRKLSKTKVLPSTLSSLSSLMSPSVSAAVSTISMLPSPPSTAALSPPSTVSRHSVTRSSTMSIRMAKWRKSMPNVPALSDLTINPDAARSNAASAPSPPKSAEPRVSGFDRQRQQELPPLPRLASKSKECASVRRASTFLSSNNFDKDYEQRERGREKEKFLSPSERGEVPRSRSHGVLPRVNGSEKGKNSIGFGTVKHPGNGLIDSRGRRIHSVRELAILPVQRVTRYALLFRDLLKYTPASSPSRPLLEQASESAARIAAKCDRAQGNAEFFFSVSVTDNVG